MKRRALWLMAMGILGLGLIWVGWRVQASPAVPLPPTPVPEALPPGAVIQTVGTALDQPVAMAFDPTGRLFVTQKGGKVRLIVNDVVQATPVITFTVDECGERGLLGITVDPNFGTNHYVYVFYSADSSCGTTTNTVARFTENNGIGTNPTTIFTTTQTTGTHNGGNIHFGPDGKLYVTTGDSENPANAQAVTSKSGKLHRINADGSIPGDNPVFTDTGALPSLFARGLRNSFDFAFDPLSSYIFASENGPNCDDEMNRVVGGYNYGWRSGYPCDDNSGPSPTYNTIPPLWYLPSAQCCVAPTGIEVYSGPRVPQWQNGLFMCSYNDGQLRHFYLDGTRTQLTAIGLVNGVTCNMDIATSPDGAFYYIEGGGYSAGTIMRIIGSGGTATPVPPSPTATRTATLTPIPTATPTNTPGGPSPTPVPPSATATPTLTPLPTQTPGGPSATPAPTHTPTGTSTHTPTHTPTLTPLPTQTPGGPSATPEPSHTATATPTHTPTHTPTNTRLPTQTPGGPSATPEPSHTPTVTATVCPLQFNDVPSGSTFYDYVRCLACRLIIQGYPCGGPGEPCPGAYFRPGNNVTRGQTAKIVVNSTGITDPIPSTQQTFEDVAPGSPFWRWIEQLAGRGTISGYPCGGPGELCQPPGNRPYFRPNNPVTRGQLAKIDANTAGYSETPTGQTFEDVPPGSPFYLYVERSASRGIINGYPCGGAGEPCLPPGNRPYFRPNTSVTRGQAAKIVAATFFPGCQTPARR